MRSCIITALVCVLIPAAALALGPWQQTPGNTNVAVSPIQRIGPANHVVGPTAALLRLPGPGHHLIGPVAALLGLLGGGYHYLGPTAANQRLSDGGGFHYLGPEAVLERWSGGGRSDTGSAR